MFTALAISVLSALSGFTEVVYEVRINAPADIDTISRAGLSVDHYDGKQTVRAYGSPGDDALLAAMGFNVVEIERRPFLPRSTTATKGTEPAYHTYATMTSELEARAAAYPNIARLISLGKSVQDRELWALLISDNPDADEEEPEFKYISTMHGDEWTGTEMCMYFIEKLLTEYDSPDGDGPRVTQLVNSTAIWIVPCMNPDGFEIPTRRNANNIDLNRSFPNYPVNFAGTMFSGEPLLIAGYEPEIQHVMTWSAANSFVLAANFHTGALVVNYPYDYEPDIRSGFYAIAPDDDLLVDLSLRYSTFNAPMFSSILFSRGITNGSEWFAITGGMQDWNYRYLGGIENTIELSDEDMPPESQLPIFWADNEESMLKYLESVHIGAHGLVTDRVFGWPLWAQVNIDTNTQPVFTDPDVGDYYRLLLPGVYTLSYSAPGHITWHEPAVTIVDDTPVRVDVELSTGDINSDLHVDASDVQLLVLALLGEEIAFNADLDGGGVAATDLQALINQVLHAGA